MGDADFGYVGGAPSKINRYGGRESVKYNFPEIKAATTRGFGRSRE